MKILQEYSYLNDILACMQRGEKLPVSEIYVFGSRFCGKTVDYAAFVIKSNNLVKADGSDFVKVATTVYRNERQDLLETYDDYNTFIDNEALENGWYKVDSRLTWHFANGNKVKFDYVKKKTKNKTYGKGKSQMIGDYIIIVIEEATELQPKNYKDIYNAVRGLNPNASILFVYICNPENPANHLVQKTMKYLPFDEDTMFAFGHQHAVVNITGLSDQPENILIHYVNWRAIQNYKIVDAPGTVLGHRYVALDPIIVPQYKLDNIAKAYEFDELGAKVDDIGCPGASVENMLLRYVPTLEEAVYYRHSFLVGGGDLGYGQTGSSGYTAFHLIGYDMNGNTDVYATFKWDQKIMWKDNMRILEDIVDWYIQEINEYCNATGDYVNADYPVIIKVDNSAATDISYLQEVARQRGVGDCLKFVPCVKCNRWDRFRAIVYLCSQKKLRINHFKCKPLIEEMCAVKFDGEAKSFKTIGDDHCLDALCYAWGNAFYNFRDDETLQGYFNFDRKNKTIVS